MYSFVIKIATEVKKAVEGVNTIPTLGFIKNTAEIDIADTDSNKVLVIVTNTFFYSNFYSFL